MKKDLTKYANQANWPSDLNAAKDFAREAVTTWKWKEKAPKFLAEIDEARTIKRLQEIVIYPLLSGEGMKAIK